MKFNFFSVYSRSVHLKTVAPNETPDLEIANEYDLVWYESVENRYQSDQGIACCAEIEQANHMTRVEYVSNAGDVKR